MADVKALSREDILKAEDRRIEVVEVPEWGGSVRVRSMTGAERDQFEGEVLDIRRGGVELKRANFRARLVVRTVVGDDDKPMFSPGDLEALGAKSAAALDRVIAIAMRLNGLEPGALEAAAKN